jgi:hypothetical protein
LTFDLPEGAKASDVIEMEFTIRDPVMGTEYVNCANFPVLAAVQQGEKKPPKKEKMPPGQPPGEQPDGQAGIDFPVVHWVKPEAPNWATHFATPDDCLTIVDDGEEVGGKWQADFKFYLNEGNKALQNELKVTKFPAAAVKKQYEIGVVLVGMALIHDDKQHGVEKAKESNGEKKEDEDVFKRATAFTRAVAPIIIPMIQALGELAEDEVDVSDLVGKAA